MLYYKAIYNYISVKYEMDKKIMKYTSVACLKIYDKLSKHIL